MSPTAVQRDSATAAATSLNKKKAGELRRSSLSAGMLKAISGISELDINNTIKMHPAFACQNMDMFLDMVSGQKQAFIPYLVGNPGTGKTYAAERLLDNSLARIRAVFSSHSGKKGDLEKALSGCVDEGLLGDTFAPDKSKELVGYLGDSEALAKMMAEVLGVYADAGNREKELIRPKFSELLYSIKAMAEARVSREDTANWLEKSISPDVYVLPAAFSALDKISEEMYIISQSGIERKVKHPIMKMVSDAYSGIISVLIIDEASETIKEKEAARVKNLHPLLDAQVNGKPLFMPIMPESMDSETRKELEILRKATEARMEQCRRAGDADGEERMETLLGGIGMALSGKAVTLEIPLPETFCIFMTGNMRKEHEQLGFTESTWRRVQPIRFSYLPPGHMELFIRDLEKKYKESLRAETGESFNIIEKEMGERRGQFVNGLVELYKKVYEEYTANPGAFSSRMLPSLRSVSHALRAFESYYAMSRMLKENRGSSTVECAQLALQSRAMMGSSFASIVKKGGKLADMLPTQQEFGEFLLAAMELSTFIPVGSFTETSETRSSEAQLLMNEKGRGIFVARGLLSGRSSDPDAMFSITLGKDEYIYSKPNFMYLAYSLANALSHQRFLLMVGESQEGKTTIAEVSRKILERESAASGNVRYFAIDDTEEFTLKDPNVETQVGGERKALRKSVLRHIIEEASADPETTYLIKVDEIDNIRFSQELNSLFTRKSVSVGGKDLSLGNIVIMGTSNMSRVMLDNFVSRSGIPLVFTRSLSRVEYSGQNFDVRNIYLLHSALEKALGSGEKADEAISKIISDSALSEKVAKAEFYEIAKSRDSIGKYIRAAGAKASASDYVQAIAAYIDSIGTRNAERERMKRGDVIG